MGKLWVCDGEKLTVPQNGSILGLDDYYIEFSSILPRCGHPDLVMTHNWRGPSLVMNGCFPANVLLFGPLQGQLIGLHGALSAGSTKLVPLCREGTVLEGRQEEKGQKSERLQGKFGLGRHGASCSQDRWRDQLFFTLQ